VSRVHGPVDHGNSAGPRVHYGQRPWDGQGSLDLGRSAALVDGSSLQRRAKGRGETRFSLRASATGEEAELSWQRWTMVAAVLTR
jgi:hypothetical protein